MFLGHLWGLTLQRFFAAKCGSVIHFHNDWPVFHSNVQLNDFEVIGKFWIHNWDTVIVIYADS